MLQLVDLFENVLVGKSSPSLSFTCTTFRFVGGNTRGGRVTFAYKRCRPVSLFLVVCAIAIQIVSLSVDTPLSVELLVKELKDVTNWYVFGVSLGIPISQLDTIKKEYSDVEEQTIKMFQFWLQYSSWKMVIQALEQNGYLILAAELSERYLIAEADSTLLATHEPKEEQGIMLL